MTTVDSMGTMDEPDRFTRSPDGEPNNKREKRTIDVCGDCGRAYVGWHKCGPVGGGGGGGTTREEREALSRADDGDPEDTVIYVPGRADSAYHEPAQARDEQGNFDEGLEPQCDAEIKSEDGPNGTTRQWEPTTRAKARSNSTRFPCRQCHDLDLDDGDEYA